MTHILSYFIILLCAIPAALAIELAPAEEISLAYTLVKAKRYTDAVLRVQPLLDALKLDTIETIVKGNKLLAVSYCELGEKEKAQDTLGTVLAFSPNEPFSEFPLSKECMAFFGVKKPEPKAPLKRTLEKPAPVLAPVISAIETTPLDETPPIQDVPPKIESPLVLKSEPTDRWKLYLPMGSGQFYNDQTSKGYAFMSSQIVGLASAASMFILFKNAQNSDGSFSNTDRAHLYKNIYWSSLGLATSSAIWGLIDGWIIHRKKSKGRTLGLEPAGHSSAATAGNYAEP